VPRPAARNDVWPLLLGLLAAGGVLCLVLAGTQAPHLFWTRVGAGAHGCASAVSRGSRGRVTTHYRCELVWRADGATHHRWFDLPAGTVRDGDRVPLRVHGDAAVRPDALWTGVAGFGVLGLLLLAAPVTVLVRRRLVRGRPGRRGGRPAPRAGRSRR
jgi:hypothetical protein